MQNISASKMNGKRVSGGSDQKAKGLSSSVYSEESLKKVQEAVDALNAIIASTSQDKGAAKLSAIYDKTNNGDNDKDPLNYYGYAQGEYASRLAKQRQPHCVRDSQVSLTALHCRI